MKVKMFGFWEKVFVRKTQPMLSFKKLLISVT